MTTNAANLQLALDWLKAVISGRLRLHLGQAETFEVGPLNLSSEPSSLSAFLEHYNPDFAEFTLMLLALAPHLHPNFFSQIIAEHLPEGGDFPEFGGVKAQNHRASCPPARLPCSSLPEITWNNALPSSSSSALIIGLPSTTFLTSKPCAKASQQ